MRYLLLLILAVNMITFSQDKEIYKNAAFKVTRNSVREGKYTAIAVTDSEITSNYSPAFQENFNRLLTFKFSLNGLDNEARPGTDHKVYLNPLNGKFITPIYTFGDKDPAGADMPQGTDNPLIPNDSFVVVFRLNMKPVLDAFAEKGYYTTYDGQKISKKSFTGVSIAGSAEPLTWNFADLAKSNMYKLQASENGDIYEITLRFYNHSNRELSKDGSSSWKLKRDLQGFPRYSSEYPILNALYNLSLEELISDVRKDGALMAGAKWDGVWTRDVSYSTLLSLAIVLPDACKTSLMAKVKNGIIIQDTGTGGSWPVSSDRMVWALAAYEIFLTTGDRAWLQDAYAIISRSVEADKVTLSDPSKGLIRGESSFLDWREQTYPHWMMPVDIYNSFCLGTNVVHARTYAILAEIAGILGKDAKEYSAIFNDLKKAINKNLWMEDKGYYGQFIYGRNYQTLSTRSESLGESLSILFHVAGDKAESILRNSPTTVYGTPCVFPQSAGLPAYHNNAIWPFVEAYRMWAAKESANEEAMLHSIASIVRASSLFLTNKENFVAGTGSNLGTEINSDRQLWSIAGNLSIVYRALFGMEFTPDYLELRPFIPNALKGIHKLTGLKYGNACFSIQLNGEGNKVTSFLIDGVENPSHRLNRSESGNHSVEITLAADAVKTGQNLTANVLVPEAPEIVLSGDSITWKPRETDKCYVVYRNGLPIDSATTTAYCPAIESVISEYQIAIVDLHGEHSALSRPLRVGKAEHEIPIEQLLSGKNKYLKLNSKIGESYSFTIDIPADGCYAIDYCYANGNGPINTDNKCAIRSMAVDNRFCGPIVLPQRGTNEWDNWGFTNAVYLNLEKGNHLVRLYFDKLNMNMNGSENSALVKTIRITKLDADRKQ